jgi:hypothetical protein
VELEAELRVVDYSDKAVPYSVILSFTKDKLKKKLGGRRFNPFLRTTTPQFRLGLHTGQKRSVKKLVTSLSKAKKIRILN